MSDADDAVAVSSDNESKFHKAIDRGDLKAVRHYVEKEGVDVDCRYRSTEFRKTEGGRNDLVDYLLSRNAPPPDVVEETDEDDEYFDEEDDHSEEEDYLFGMPRRMDAAARGRRHMARPPTRMERRMMDDAMRRRNGERIWMTGPNRMPAAPARNRLSDRDRYYAECKKTFKGVTPLTIASYNGSAKLVRYLLSMNADVEGYSLEGMTPLIAAAMRGKGEVVNVLLDEGRAKNVNYMDRFGNTALIMAIRMYSSHFTVESLLRYGANVNPPRNTEKQSPPLLHACERTMASNIVRLLLENGADVHARGGEHRDTCLHKAANHCKSDDPTVRLLIAHGANIDALSKKGLSPLVVAASRLNFSLMRDLLDLGAKIDVSSAINSIMKYVTTDAEACSTVLHHYRRTMSESDIEKVLLQPIHTRGGIALHRVEIVACAKLLIEQPRLEGKHLLPVCHAQLVQKDGGGSTPKDVAKGRKKIRDPRLLAYLESFESLPLSIPVDETVSSTTPKKLPSYRIAVKLNPALNDFQRSVAEEAAQLIMGTTGLPDRVAYAILGCLVPLDVMKRSATAETDETTV